MVVMTGWTRCPWRRYVQNPLESLQPYCFTVAFALLETAVASAMFRWIFQDLVLTGPFVGPPCSSLRSPGHLSHHLPPPWPPHSPWLARWCGPLRLGPGRALDCVLYWRRMVLVLAACPTRLRWLRAMRRLELLELPVQSTHLHPGKDGDCGQCIPGPDPVSTYTCESSVRA